MTELQALTEGGIDYILKEGSFVWEVIPKQPSLVVISVPHDGFPAKDFTGLVQPLLPDMINPGLLSARDLNIWPIAKDIACQTPVTIVRGLLPRSFVDYNRRCPRVREDELQNLEEPDINIIIGQQLWENYHSKLKSAIERSTITTEQASFPVIRPLLLDLHGFVEQPSYGEYDLIFGTHNGQTISYSIDARFAAYLLDLGYRVFLPKRKSWYNMRVGENDKYPGGEIILNCHRMTTAPCIQIEIHQSFRTRENQSKGIKLAKDIAGFFQRYTAENWDTLAIPNQLSIEQSS